MALSMEAKPRVNWHTPLVCVCVSVSARVWTFTCARRGSLREATDQVRKLDVCSVQMPGLGLEKYSIHSDY